MRRQLLYILIISLSACAELFSPQPSLDQSALRGYRIPCRGAVLVMNGDTSSSSVLVPAGKQQLTIYAIGELEEPEFYNSGNSYYCRIRSQHTLSFTSAGGKTYRLHSDKRGPLNIEISVWEGIDEKAISTQPVLSTTKQIDAKRECGFFPGCDMPFGN